MLKIRCILPQLWDGYELSNLKSKTALLLWAVLFVLLLIWRIQNLDAFGLSNDEGAHLMWAQLAVDGYPLYQETRAVQQPLFLGWIAWAFRLFGPTITVGRWIIVSSFMLLALTVSWLADRTAGRWAALAALMMVGLSPLIFSLSRLVMAEIPAVALASLSVALLVYALDRPGWGWLLTAGLAFGLSLMIKLLNPFVAAPLGLLFLWRMMKLPPERRWRYRVIEGSIFAFGMLLPLLLILWAYDTSAMMSQLIAFRGDLRAAIPGSWTETGQMFSGFLRSHWGVWLLALGGIVTVWLRAAPPDEETPPNGAQRFWRYRLVWLLWLTAGMAMLVWHTPLFPHHFVVLLPPLMLLAAGFVADVAMLWRQGGWRRQVAAGGAVVIAVAIFNAPAMVSANQETAAIVTGGREAEAIALLRAISAPDDFLMGDSQLLIFLAERRTPPPLGDVALVAIKAGWQTSARMTDLTRTYRAPAVVQWSLRLPWLPDYLEWVEANYLARRVWDNDHIIYFVPRLPLNQPLPNEQQVRLGETITLRGYEVERLRPGHLSLKIYWQTDKPLAEDYTVFTQLLNDNGEWVAGWDSQPLGGHFPTTAWPAGEIVTDVVQMPLPADLPPGDYRLITGLYRLETLERLLTEKDVDHIVLTMLKLKN